MWIQAARPGQRDLDFRVDVQVCRMAKLVSVKLLLLAMFISALTVSHATESVAAGVGGGSSTVGLRLRMRMLSARYCGGTCTCTCFLGAACCAGCENYTLASAMGALGLELESTATSALVEQQITRCARSAENDQPTV